MADSSKKGEVVVLKEFNGNPILGRVWACVPGSVLINDDENFRLREKGEAAALEPVGFPLQDVFQFEEEMWNKLRAGEIGWSQMKRWSN